MLFDSNKFHYFLLFKLFFINKINSIWLDILIFSKLLLKNAKLFCFLLSINSI